MIDEASVRRRPGPGVLWILVAFALLAAACGADGGGDGAASDDQAGYCELTTRQREQDDRFFASAATPEDVEAYFLESRTRLEDAIAVAPEEIRADLELSAGGLDTLIDALIDSDWDVRTVSPAALSSEELGAAADRLDSYDAEFCGLGGSESSPSTPEPGVDAGNPFGQSPEQFAELLETESGREQMIDALSVDKPVTEEQAACLVDNLDPDVLFALAFVDSDPSPSQIDELFGAFDRCDVAPELFG